MDYNAFMCASAARDFCNEIGEDKVVSVTHLNKNTEYPWVVFYKDNKFQ